MAVITLPGALTWLKPGLNTDKASRIARVADYLAGDRFLSHTATGLAMSIWQDC